MRGRNTWSQQKARQREVWSVGVKGVRGIDGDIGIATTRRYAKIGQAAHVIGAAIGEDSAVVGLAFISERERSIEARRTIRGLIPAPEVHAAWYAPDRDHVDGSLRIDAVAGLDALHNECERPH